MSSKGKATNVEVCTRIRPMVVDTSGTPFFSATAATTPSRISSPSASTNSNSKLSLASRRGVKPWNVSTATTNMYNSKFTSRLHPPPSRTPANKSSASTPAATAAAAAATTTGLETAYNAWNVVDNTTVKQSEAHTEHIQGRTEHYTLDRVYGASSTSKELYTNSVKPVVLAAMEGYHASVFAYGQTSTGKTHTMTGTTTAPGVLPLSVQDCFDYVSSGQNDEQREYLLRMSYLEIYNEQIIDLLSDTPTAVRIFESPKEGVVIRGLREEVVTSPQDVHHWILQGELRRQVGSTNMNKHSSRSHAIFRLWIESKSAGGGVRVSSLSLVDLAGSESVRLTGSTGDRQKEGQYINKSLTTLGQVVFKLSELQRRHDDTVKAHIPYRDSKLTRMLQPSLSGNAQIVIISCISPEVSHLQESHNTLKFAVRAKRIQQHATVSEVADEKTMLQTYRDEIQNLKQQLEDARNSQTTQVTTTIESSTDDEVQDLVEAIQQMERLILTTRSITQKKNKDDDLLVAPTDSDNFLSSAFLDDEIPSASTSSSDAQVLQEMHRIKGLLSNVLASKGSPQIPLTPARDAEVELLRAQLYEQEVTTSLRKADSSFLQQQLEEKDSLLREVSKILEAVEKRQIELEQTNNLLKQSLSAANAEILRLNQILNSSM